MSAKEVILKRTVYSKCPVCGTMLEVKTENGDIVRHFKPKKKNEEEDLLSSALNDLKEQGEKLEKAFQKGKEAEKAKEKRLENIFNDKKKEAREQGVDAPPVREFDLD